MKAEQQHLLQQIQEKQQNLRRLEAQSSVKVSLQQQPPPTLSDFALTSTLPTPSMTSSNPLFNPPPPLLNSQQPTYLSNQTTNNLCNQSINTLLSNFPTGHTPNLPSQSQQTSTLSLAEVFRQQEQRGAEIFLRPTKSTDNGQGKLLRIIDFVSRLRPTEEERVITTDSGSQTTLLLSVGNKNPQLEHVRVEEYSIANIRIFYELLTSGKLPTATDIRDYLSYSIKVFELARKYSWESVLNYDDEFRVQQHMYGYPWSYDHSHLHEVMLIPRWAHSNSLNSGRNTSTRSSNGQVSVPTGTHNALGQEICRNFNRSRGCQNKECRFSHVCNRKIAGQVCGKPHSGSQHNSIEK